LVIPKLDVCRFLRRMFRLPRRATVEQAKA
jgi:hypothetical protein